MRRACLAALALILLAAPATAAAETTWTEADKDGYGTSTRVASKVWHTLDDGRLTEVFYPDLGTPSVRTLEFVVSDRRGFSQADSEARRQSIRLLDSRSLTYRQVNEQPGRYRIAKTYVTDPARNVLLVEVKFRSLSGKRLRLSLRYDPSLGNDHEDDNAHPSRRALLASDSGSPVASAVRGSPRFARTASAPQSGDVVQTARTSLTGVGRRQRMTVALGFGERPRAASRAALESLRAGFRKRSAAYRAGWHAYLRGIRRAPAAADRRMWNVSAMTLAAHEDKTYRGAYIASPSMPWVWGTGLENPSGAYHLVWSRDLYQIGTALIAAGDRAGANRAVDYLFFRQQKPDGSFPQNSTVDGTEHWTNLQLDEVALPIALAHLVGKDDARTYRGVKKAADFLAEFVDSETGRLAPYSPQERWENQAGYSPNSIAAQINGLVSAAAIARENGDNASARRWLDLADEWQASVKRWTVTRNGPLSGDPYFLRITKDGNPQAGTTYSIGDGGPSAVDQRRVVDASFLDLVRYGILRPGDRAVLNTLDVVDRELRSRTPNGPFWHRFSFDGYGETEAGAQWAITEPDTFTTLGRGWPLLTGERGEYAVTAGEQAGRYLATMARAAGPSGMLSEQVWDGRPPSGESCCPEGEGTRAATPLVWSHSGLVRLAWTIQRGTPVDQQPVVARRYLH